MRSQRVTLRNRSGLSLAGTLDLPGQGKVSECVIHSHCITYWRNLKSYINIDRALTARGVAVLRLDFTGVGESEGDFRWAGEVIAAWAGRHL